MEIELPYSCCFGGRADGSSAFQLLCHVTCRN